MHFITLTRPYGSRITINTDNILSAVDAPPPESLLGAKAELTG
jgi:hypothetical protein